MAYSHHLVRKVSRIASPTVLNGFGLEYSDQTKNQNSRKNSRRNLERSHRDSGLRVSSSGADPAPTTPGARSPLRSLLSPTGTGTASSGTTSASGSGGPEI